MSAILSSLSRSAPVWAVMGTWVGLVPSEAAATGEEDFLNRVEPVLVNYCFDCHADGVDKGEMALDAWEDFGAHTADRELWSAVWKNLRAHLMPPSEKDQPTDDERAVVTAWIEREVFDIDCENPDPGRVTVRRLNRTEYRNTVRDLLGVDFDTTDAFPADDTGYGFDNIGDVLSLSPLLMEKYLSAAEEIVGRAVYTDGPRIPTHDLWGNSFESDDDKHKAERLPLEDPVTVTRNHWVDHPGQYRLTFDASIDGASEFSGQTAELVIRVADKEVARHQLGWDNRKSIDLTAEAAFTTKGEQPISLSIVPGDPPGDEENELSLRVRKVDLHGPLDGSYTEFPDHYNKVFSDGPPPDDEAGREAYARKLLRHYATRAFRRPVDEPTLDRLVALAKEVDAQDGRRFEHGVAHALTAVLASPRFLFRAEAQPEPDNPGKIVPVDEFSLASRLSYFLWSTMPDDRLFGLAEKGELRASMASEVARMLEDGRSRELVENFVGQWMQTRDVEGLAIDARRVLRIRDREEAERIFSHNVRRAMRAETEMLFSHIMRENRSVLELIDPGYTFLNRDLARFYGLDEIAKNLDEREMEKVDLPEDSMRGGVLAHGSFLVVTSNPTRTSPVKRGLFVLENILGTPPPPPPPDVPDLEDARRDDGERPQTMRERMVIHREKALCKSCHARMDPIGLALENFNAVGMWRDEERGEPIDTSGQLVTGEPFRNVGELKKILTTDRREDFYRCLTEKLFTYALGRGVEYYDVCTIDDIVENLEKEKDGGNFSTLLMGIIESPAFQKRRGDGAENAPHTPHEG